ncbi:MAG: aldo/keto reductase [Anaerolineae bacterium]|nr:aldo/keto reductase [Anaerolineae bacterium]
MQYSHLGRTGIVVSRLCLGTMSFGCYTSEEDSLAILNEALEQGINFIDTANSYGWLGWIPDRGRIGLTEEIIGRWLSEDKTRRDRIVLATKVYAVMSAEINDRGLSAYHIRKACEDSLRRLQTDHIDLYYMHHIDRGEVQEQYKEWWGVPERDLVRPAHRRRETPWEEIWQAMEVLVEQGKVIYVGSSNFAGWNIAQSCEKASARNFLGPVCEQSVYSLSNRMVELEVIPACREYGLGLVPYSPLGGGCLAGLLEKAGSGQGRRSGVFGEDYIEAHRDRLEAYESLCRDLGETPAAAALAWLLDNPVVTAPIIGTRTIEQLRSSLRAVEIDLGEETRARLDEIWPGPGGQAPETYAW